MADAGPESDATIPTPALGSHTRVFIFISAAFVLIATLYPVASITDTSNIWCVICGERGLSDAIINVILFLPLGAAVALTGRATLAALTLCAALSGSVEFAQMTLIPGRDASLGDLVFNTLGAAAGVSIVKTSWWWLGSSRVRASRLSLAAALFAAASIVGTGVLVVPQTTGGAYFVMWRPVLKHLGRYDAPIRSATIGGQLFLPGRIEEPAQVRRMLQAGAPVRVLAVATLKTARLAAMFTIYDELKREVVLIGPDRDDLVFRVRMRSASVRLDQPDIRIVDGWRSLSPGADITVTARRSGRSYCVGFGPQPPCRSGITAGMGWTLLLYDEHWPAFLRSALSIFWLGLLGFPVGFWARRRWESLCALAIYAAAIVAAPAWVGLLDTPAYQTLGGIVGIGLGIAVARAVIVDTKLRKWHACGAD